MRVFEPIYLRVLKRSRIVSAISDRQDTHLQPHTATYKNVDNDTLNVYYDLRI